MFTNGAINLKEHELNKIDNSPSNRKLGVKLPTRTITCLCKELHHLSHKSENFQAINTD